ncbi:MAG: alpha/beta hydrolase [Scytonema sp. PMC 1070.18]|nr:alpha/beta hydrolase [Scytonema sp. PMC 1070.18]
MSSTLIFDIDEEAVSVELGNDKLEGELVIPSSAKGIVVVGQHTSSIKYCTRNRYFAHLLRRAGLATILINLLTKEEELLDQRSKHYGYDIRHLASRLVGITDWLTKNSITKSLKIGYISTGAGGGAALLAAMECQMLIKAVVSQSGYTDLINPELSYLQTPTLLIVGGHDYPTIAMNEDTLTQISAQNKRLEIIPKASHLFQEPGALEEAARLASQWFKHFLCSN